MKKFRIAAFLVVEIVAFLLLYIRSSKTITIQNNPVSENPENCQIRECENGQSQIYLEGIGWSPCADRCTKKDLETNGGKKSCTCPEKAESDSCTNICLTFGDPCSTKNDYYQWTGCR